MELLTIQVLLSAFGARTQYYKWHFLVELLASCWEQSNFVANFLLSTDIEIITVCKQAALLRSFLVSTCLPILSFLFFHIKLSLLALDITETTLLLNR